MSSNEFTENVRGNPIGGSWMFCLEEINRFNWSDSRGQTLKEKRTLKKLSLEDLAQSLEAYHISVSRQFLHQFETGKNKYITPKQLIALCEVLNCSPKDFFNSSIFLAI